MISGKFWGKTYEKRLVKLKKTCYDLQISFVGIRTSTNFDYSSNAATHSLTTPIRKNKIIL